MSLLEEIQSAAVDSNSDLGELLRKCKVLGARLGSKPLEDWLVRESNGYLNNIELPDYRVWAVELKGNFSGPWQSLLSNAPIPSACVPRQFRDTFTVFRCRSSVAVVQELLRDNNGSNIHTTVGNLPLVIGTRVYIGLNCIQAWGEFGSGHLVEVLNAVRNRLLDFVLAIWKENPTSGDLPEDSKTDKIPPQRVTQIFNTTVYGGSASLVGTANDSHISFNVQANDFKTLARTLEDAGVKKSDITQLKKAIDDDPAPQDSTCLGPRVADWLSKMVGKAASGGWDIGAGAAATLLASAIAQYYGITP